LNLRQIILFSQYLLETLIFEIPAFAKLAVKKLSASNILNKKLETL